MRVFLLFFGFFLLIILCTSCSQSGSSRHPDPPAASQVVEDTTDFAVIAFNPNHPWPFKHTYKPAALSKSEIQLLNCIVKDCIMNYNRELAPNLKPSYGIDMIKYKYKYKRQYMAVVNKIGQKVVWVNGFCNTWNKQWKKEIVFVQDGGNCYFNIKINLTTKECFGVSVNGYA